MVWAKAKGHGYWPAHIMTPASKVAKRPSVEAPAGHVYVGWLGEDFARTVPEMLPESRVENFDGGFAHVWAMGAGPSRKGKATTASKDKFLRSLEVALAFAPDAQRVRTAADALGGLTEEELGDVGQNPTAYEQKRSAAMEENTKKIRDLFGE